MQRMTLYQTFCGSVLVFRTVQDGRLSLAAEQFPNRTRPSQRVAAPDALRTGRAPADGGVAGAAGDLRLFAAGQFPAVSAGAALSEMGFLARRPRWHRRARR